MPDLDKVLNGLNCEENKNCRRCPYIEFGECRELLIRDIKMLLKDQNSLIKQYEHACQTCKSRLEGVKPF